MISGDAPSRVVYCFPPEDETVEKNRTDWSDVKAAMLRRGKWWQWALVVPGWGLAVTFAALAPMEWILLGLVYFIVYAAPIIVLLWAIREIRRNRREAWLWKNKEALDSVRRGLRQSAEGNTRELGSFAEYAEEDEDGC